MQHRVDGRDRSGLAKPRVGQFPQLARSQPEFAAECADEGGVAAEPHADGEVDQPRVLGGGGYQLAESKIEPLLSHIMRKPAIGLEQPVKGRARDLEVAAKLAYGERVGLEIVRDTPL